MYRQNWKLIFQFCEEIKTTFLISVKENGTDAIFVSINPLAHGGANKIGRPSFDFARRGKSRFSSPT